MHYEPHESDALVVLVYEEADSDYVKSSGVVPMKLYNAQSEQLNKPKPDSDSCDDGEESEYVKLDGAVSMNVYEGYFSF